MYYSFLVLTICQAWATYSMCFNSQNNSVCQSKKPIQDSCSPDLTPDSTTVFHPGLHCLRGSENYVSEACCFSHGARGANHV